VGDARWCSRRKQWGWPRPPMEKTSGEGMATQDAIGGGEGGGYGVDRWCSRRAAPTVVGVGAGVDAVGDFLFSWRGGS
jgi:hypothetical protein